MEYGKGEFNAMRDDELRPVSDWADREAAHTENKFDQVKTTVADKLRTAAGRLSEESQAGRVNLGGYGDQVAGWLNRSADYVGHFDPQRARVDLENQVKRNPARSLLIAGAAGLVLGALFRRR
jgi:ElaB/YqjD/DUF883 family membrane-anchored ribosome-binding protein